MSDFDWSEYLDADGRFSFETVGDTAKGRVTAIRTENGTFGKCPVLTLQVDAEGNTRDLWIGGADLRPKIAERDPQVGCMVEVTLTELKNTGKGNPLKVYDVKVGAPKAAPEPTPAPPAYEDGTEPF